MKRCIIAVLVVAALPALADEPKVYLPQFALRTSVCGEGQALTYTLQCDPGSRTPIDRVWLPQRGVGLELCKASEMRCEPIRGASLNARPGFEVEDATDGDLVIVGFGLRRLLGEEP